MTWPFSLPTWLPWWVPIAVLVPVLLYAVLLLAMPFSVFGLKGRLDQLQDQLDEIQDELRRLASRPPEVARYAGNEPPPHLARGSPPPRMPREDEPVAQDRPPPAPETPLRAQPLAPRYRTPEDTPRRVEPRLDWPRQ